MNNNDSNNSYSEQNEINQNLSNDDNNSIISNSDNINKSDDFLY